MELNNCEIDLMKMKHLRENRNLSHKAIATLLGFETAQGYYYKESGKTKFSAIEIKMLADFYEIDVGELYQNSSKPKN